MILRGGLVVDGTGTPARRADVEIENGLITAVGHLGEVSNGEIRDVGGLVVAPGFVDIHSHSDLSILGHPDGTSKILQGVTTEVVGNCGLSVVPAGSLEVATMMRPAMSYCDDPSVVWDWTSVAGYRARVAAAQTGPSIEILVGHGILRASVVGLEDRPATSNELARMCAMLDVALSEGAVGMSLGLMYPPSSYAREHELIALGNIIAKHDGLLACHLANYSGGLLQAISSVIRIAEASGSRLQISHLTAVGRENWGSVIPALLLLDEAVSRGVDVAADFYPYLAGSTNLSQLLPGWAMSGGVDALRVRLDDQAVRLRLKNHLKDCAWEDFLLVSSKSAPELDGMRIPQASAMRGVEPASLTLDLLAQCDPVIVAFGRSEDDLRAVMRHPLSVLGSDGLAIDTFGTVGGGAPHPRFFGAFPALFQKYVRDELFLTLEEAVLKCTWAAAKRVGLRNRGLITPGLRADLVVFDPEMIADNSTFADSRQVPSGIVSVFREGIPLVQDGVVLQRT